MDQSSRSVGVPYFRGTTGPALLGLSYLLGGVLLFVALLTDWFGLVAATLAFLLFLLVVSLAIVIRAEGVLTPENGIIGVCVFAAMGLLFVLSSFTNLRSELVFGVVFVVGVLLPHVVLTTVPREQ